jgi:ABC-type phosphonate transport system ATPase subunit
MMSSPTGGVGVVVDCRLMGHLHTVSRCFGMRLLVLPTVWSDSSHVA